MESICTFVPSKDYSGSIKTVHFVQEGNFKALPQPFCYPIHHLFLVTSGNGILHLMDSVFPLEKGCLFFSFPQCLYSIDATDDFSYIYISFMGECVTDVLNRSGVCVERPVYTGYEHLMELWQNSIQCVTTTNAGLMSEGVLQYTLAMLLRQHCQNKTFSSKKSRFALVIEYVDNHYRDPELTLTDLANTFTYTPKYLSHIFSEYMGVGFTKYINTLRVQYACKLMEEGATSVAEVASSCGFADPMYFSRLFKHHTGFSPQAFMKRCAIEE